MARRKPAKKGGYKTSSGYQITKKDYEKIKSEIKNYNRRVERARAKADEILKDTIPAKISLKEQRESFTSKKDINRFLRDLKKYDSKGLEIVSEQGVLITRAELSIFKERLAAENRRRKKLMKEVSRIREDEGRFPTQGDEDLAQIQEREYGSIEDLRRTADRFTERNVNERALMWQESYIRTVQDRIVEARISGVDDPEFYAMCDEIIEIVQGLSEYEYEIAERTIPQLHVSIVSDTELFMRGAREVLNKWEKFKEELT